jgi:hypothetical protein
VRFFRAYLMSVLFAVRRNRAFQMGDASSVIEVIDRKRKARAARRR